MNSHQRRKDRREYKHLVTTTWHSYDQYCVMWDWLSAMYGSRSDSKRHAWREAWLTTGTEWQFINEKDAIMFALRWK